MRKKRIAAIDGNSLINRAFYALPQMTSREGIHTNAVYGFMGMLGSVISTLDPDCICVAFDLKEPTFRHKEYSEYKAGRKKMPVELAEQFPIIKKLLRAMDIKVLELAGFEADDIIGTVAKRGEAEGMEPFVITGDKDALQLASDITRVLITKKGVSEFDTYDADAMMERYHMTPSQFIDLKGLMGDNSDNIPGIPGVGEKTGIKLIEEFGSVENLVENYESIKKPALRAKVEEYRMQAMMSKRLATINTNVPIETDFETFSFDKPDKGEVLRIYRELQLFSLVGKIDKTWLGKYDGGENPGGGVGTVAAGGLKEAAVVGLAAGVGVADGSAERPEIPAEGSVGSPIEVEAKIPGSQTPAGGLSDEIKILKEGEEGINDAVAGISSWPYVFLKVFGDGGHVEEPKLISALFCGPETCLFLKSGEIIAEAASVVSANRVPVKGHMLKDDFYMLKAFRGFGPEGEAGLENGFETAFDTAIAEYVLEPSRNDYGHKAMAIRYGLPDIEDEKDFAKANSQVDLFGSTDENYLSYGLKILKQAAAIEPVQRGRLADWSLEKVYYEIELPLVEIFADMEYRGFPVNTAVLDEVGAVINEKVTGLEERIYDLAGEKFNINSPKQLGVILFEKLGLPAGKKTKTGYSTSVDVLEKLREDYEIVGLILEYRTLTKLMSTYVSGLKPLVCPEDGKIRAHFQQTVAATGRISCTEPNLQNIPVRQEQGRQLRRAFVPENGYLLVDADYSQIELRVLAHISGDENMIEAFRNGADIHRSTAARVFEVEENEVTPEQRSGAKAVNFGVIYGMSSFGLSENLKITRKQAEKYIADYFEKYTGVKSYMDGVVDDCKKNGYVTTIFGRRREIPDIKASNYVRRQLGERLAMNSPIQGSAADIIKIAMIKVFAELKKQGLRSKLILQVHDELIINTVPEEEASVKELLRRCMMEAADLAVPLEVGMESGATWFDIH